MASTQSVQSGFIPPFASVVAPSPAESRTGVDMAAVFHAEEVSRSRVFYLAILVIVGVTGAFSPLLAGEVWLRAINGAACVGVCGIALVALLVLRKPSRYSRAVAATIGCVGVGIGITIIYYIGVFSAGAMLLALAVYFYGTSHSTLVARSVYATIAGLYLIVSIGVASGLIPDLSLFHTRGIDPFTPWFQVIMSQVNFALIFYLARSTRRAGERAVERVRDANLQVRKRDALLAEAQGELARVEGAGQGRFTGETIGRYELGDLLGRGAMGDVYSAMSDEGVSVAVKMLHPSLLEQEENVQRFAREAQAASAVDTAHVPCVYEVGETKTGVPFLAMELLEGHDLGWHLRRNGRLAPVEVAAMCEQVANALAAVRDAGIVHRDLKPGNLFLTDTIPRTWKVLDFGLSKIVEHVSSLTGEMCVGTPSYMAPEQIIGPEVDHQADLYALAAIAYRAITGVPPLSGTDIGNVLYDVLHTQPASPSDYVRIPVDVELVLAIGIAKRREDRFATVEHFASAMRAATEGRLEPETQQRGWALIKRFPWGETIDTRPSVRPPK
jgi:eukaryotic-like serine/threonine-protein kinase